MGARSIAVALAAVLSSCAVDTELGLDATIDAATVQVTTAAVSASVDVTYRVGAYAEDARVFQPQAIDLFVGDELIVSLPPSLPADFEPNVAPGESRNATLEGGMSGVTDPTRLCGADVRVVFTWVDQTTLEVGTTEAIADDVTCS